MHRVVAAAAAARVAAAAQRRVVLVPVVRRSSHDAAAGATAWDRIQVRARSTTSSGSGVKAAGGGLSGSAVYETDVALNEYLQFHYATDAELCPFVDADADVEPRYAHALRQIMSFPVACADTLADAAGVRPGGNKRGTRALDVGCSVGRTSFELTRHFDRVVGLDFSQAFVDAANKMKAQGSLPYSRIVSGDVVEGKLAAVPAELGGAEARERVSFQQGDACALDVAALGGPFTGVVAANLLCRLPEPRKFLTSMREAVVPGGTLVP